MPPAHAVQAEPVANRNSLSTRSGPAFLVRTAAALLFLTALLSLPPPARAQLELCSHNRIHDIQGPGHLSPCAGMSVENVPGIVTAVRNSGFYIQDPDPDEDSITGDFIASHTSEGIFVYTTSSGAKPAVGDAVEVDGTVEEYREPSYADGLTLTRISEPGFTVLSTANPLPAPFIIGAGGTPVSDVIIDDDPEPNVETGGVFDPEPNRDAIDLYESLEGMRVQINSPVASAGTDDEGQLPVIPEDGLGYFQIITGRGLLLRPTDPNPERIYLDDSHSSVSIPDVWAGTRFPGPAIGVMHYNTANFRIVLTQALPATGPDSEVEPTASVPLASPDLLTAAAFNVENLTAANLPDDQARFDLLAAQIVNNLRSPDLLALAEIQDDNGDVFENVVSAELTLTSLTNAIQSAGGPDYAWLQINPEAYHDGGEPGANIRQVILYNPARLQPTSAPPGDYADPVGLTSSIRPHLTLNPGRIDPANSAFTASRKPLAAEFAFHGRPLFVVACHLNSKIGDQPLFGPNQPPERSTENKRSDQAQVINAFVRSILDRDPDARILVLGDLNEHDWAAPLAALKTGGDPTSELYNLASISPFDQPHYTYIYEGNAQALDHILASPVWTTAGAVDPARVVYSDVHINAERYERDPLRASDHDPVWTALDLPPLYPAYLPLVLR